MPGTDTLGQGVKLALLSDAPDAQQLASDLANGILARSIMRFDSSTHRGAVITTPVEGMVTYLRNSNTLEFYNGSSWRPFYEAMPQLPRGRVAAKYVTNASSNGTISDTELINGMATNGVTVSTSRRYRVHAAFTWISPTIGMGAKIWVGYSTGTLPSNGDGVTVWTWRVGTEPASNCNQMLSCSTDFNGPLNGTINIGVYAEKATALGGSFELQDDPVEMWFEDVGPAF